MTGVEMLILKNFVLHFLDYKFKIIFGVKI